MNEQDIIDYFRKNRHLAEVANAHLGKVAIRLIGLYGVASTGEVEKFNLRPMAKKGNITYYQFGGK